MIQSVTAPQCLHVYVCHVECVIKAASPFPYRGCKMLFLSHIYYYLPQACQVFTAVSMSVGGIIQKLPSDFFMKTWRRARERAEEKPLHLEADPDLGAYPFFFHFLQHCEIRRLIYIPHEILYGPFDGKKKSRHF